MARADANINKETLGFICSQIGVTMAFLSQRAGYTEERVRSWLDTANDAFPTINQAKGIAKVLKVPFAGLYMSKDNLPVKQLPSLRNLRTLPYEVPIDDSSLNLAVAEIIHFHDFLTSSESEMDIDAVPLSLPTILDTANVSDYATEIRTFFDLKLDDQFKLTSPRQFYLYVRQKIESNGIFVHCFTGVDVEIARGISIYNDTAPIIGINDNDRYPAKTFSIIHELVHMMTAIVAIENLTNLQKEIQLTHYTFNGLYSANASMAGFQPGEKVRAIDLLYGVMLRSGAEACIGLADHIAGSEQDFVTMMNQKAADLGMYNTHFENTTGLHNENHYTSPRLLNAPPWCGSS